MSIIHFCLSQVLNKLQLAGQKYAIRRFIIKQKGVTILELINQCRYCGSRATWDILSFVPNEKYTSGHRKLLMAKPNSKRGH